MPGTSVHPHKFEIQNGSTRWLVCAETEGELKTWVDGLLFNKRPTWQRDEATDRCTSCDSHFTLFKRRHHCRACGQLCCDDCAPMTSAKPLPGFGYFESVRVCPCRRSFLIRPSFLKNEPPTPPPSFGFQTEGFQWEKEPVGGGPMFSGSPLEGKGGKFMTFTLELSSFSL